MFELLLVICLMNGKINIFRSHDTDLYILDSIFCEC